MSATPSEVASELLRLGKEATGFLAARDECGKIAFGSPKYVDLNGQWLATLYDFEEACGIDVITSLCESYLSTLTALEEARRERDAARGTIRAYSLGWARP